MATLATPSYAQFKAQDSKDPLQLQYEREAKERQDIDKDYDATMKRTRANAPVAKRDPWATVRPSAGADSKR